MNIEETAAYMMKKYLPITNLIGETSESAVYYAKKCAIICCDEIIEALSLYKGMHDQSFIDTDKAFYKGVKYAIKQL